MQQPQYKGIPYTEPEGTVWVEIAPALIDTFHAAGNGTVTEAYPVVRITTYPGTTYGDRRFVSLRGRRYSIDSVYAYADSRWRRDIRLYSKGLMQESGNQVTFPSAVWDRLRAIEERVLARFTTGHPGWACESRRLQAARALSDAEGELGRQRGELAAAEAAVEAARAALASVAAPAAVAPAPAGRP